MQTIVVLLLSAGIVYGNSEKFLGKYKAIAEKRENTQALAEAYGGVKDLSDQILAEFIKVRDEYHHKFSVESAHYSQDLPFKFGEQREGSYNGTNFRYKYTQDGDVIKSSYDVLGEKEKKTEQTYTFTDNGFDKIYRVPLQNVTAKISFQRIN